jgi:FKBP-type peptidyl-prolyl cis-trans isomerase FkpA
MRSRWVFGLILLAASCGGGSTGGSGDRAERLRKNVEASAAITTLQITDTKVGTGAEAVPGRRVKVHYTGTLLDGLKFDSSRDRGEPFEFTVGQHEVIDGWDEGVKGMRVGGIRQLVVPASMAYGAHGAGDDIPPNAALKFEIELLEVN